MSNHSKLSLEKAIELYYEKHHALQSGDMATLRKLKLAYPEIFEQHHDADIRQLIVYAKTFEKTPQYKALQKKRLKDVLKIVPT